MASNKPTMILCSKTDMNKEEISKLSDSQAWNLIYSMRKAKDNRLQVRFTGFGATEKKELGELAKKNNFKVVGSVTKKLDFLCGGENSGPTKIQKAEAQGVQFINSNEFKKLLETGEISQGS